MRSVQTSPAPARSRAVGPRVGPDPRQVPVATTDLAAVRANVRTVLARTDAAVMAVVKADGYGHGATAVARTALAAGATWLGVTGVDEALALRRAGLGKVPLLSWLNPVHADFAAAIAADIDLAVPGQEQLRAVVAAASPGRPARVHLYLDTGMNRDGASPSQWPQLCRAARDAEQEGRITVVGLMGHLPCGDTPGSREDAVARDLFGRGVHVALQAGLRPEERHLAATAAALTDPRSHHTLCRIGAGLVGIDPSDTIPLCQALTLTAPLVLVRTVAAGTPVGYGSTWRAPQATRLGLLALGYADGLPRVGRGRAEVSVGGRRRPLVGLVSMDQVVVDLGLDGRPRPGDLVTVLAPAEKGGPTMHEWARWCGTIPHEIVTGFGHRVGRRIIDGEVAA